jgi:hypothetical protein
MTTGSFEERMLKIEGLLMSTTRLRTVLMSIYRNFDLWRLCWWGWLRDYGQFLRAYVENWSHQGSAGESDYMTTAKFGESLLKFKGLKAMLISLTTWLQAVWERVYKKLTVGWCWLHDYGQFWRAYVKNLRFADVDYMTTDSFDEYI